MFTWILDSSFLVAFVAYDRGPDCCCCNRGRNFFFIFGIHAEWIKPLLLFAPRSLLKQDENSITFFFFVVFFFLFYVGPICRSFSSSFLDFWYFSFFVIIFRAGSWLRIACCHLAPQFSRLPIYVQMERRRQKRTVTWAQLRREGSSKKAFELMNVWRYPTWNIFYNIGDKLSEPEGKEHSYYIGETHTFSLRHARADDSHTSSLSIERFSHSHFSF